MLGMCAWKQVCQADVFWEGQGSAEITTATHSCLLATGL